MLWSTGVARQAGRALPCRGREGAELPVLQFALFPFSCSVSVHVSFYWNASAVFSSSPLPKFIMTVLEHACPLGQIVRKLLGAHKHLAALPAEMTAFSPASDPQPQQPGRVYGVFILGPKVKVLVQKGHWGKTALIDGRAVCLCWAGCCPPGCRI